MEFTWQGSYVPGLAQVAFGSAALAQLVHRLVPPQLVPFSQQVAVTWHGLASA